VSRSNAAIAPDLRASLDAKPEAMDFFATSTSKASMGCEVCQRAILLRQDRISTPIVGYMVIIQACVARRRGAINLGIGHKSVMNDHRPAAPDSRDSKDGRDLFSVVYVSTAARHVTLGELRHLLDGAQRRNVEEGVTGVLLYAEQRFMQYLEGPVGGLARVNDVIKAHPLHYGLIDLVRAPVEERAFAEWSMAFQVAGAFGKSSPWEQDALLASRLDNSSRSASVACDLLSKFWYGGQGSVSAALLRHHTARALRRPALDFDTGTND
jgi:hypothetical protein